MNPVLSPSIRRKPEKQRDGQPGATDDVFIESGQATKFETGMLASGDDVLDRPFTADDDGQGKTSNPLSPIALKGLFGPGSAPKPDNYAPKPSGIWSPLNWISEKLLARDAGTSLRGGPRAVYGLSVRAVMGANAQMETYNPPLAGEFTQRLGLKWGILRPRLILQGKFWLRLAPSVDDAPGEYTVFLRTRLPLLPVLPWAVIVSLPAIIPVVINQIIGFSWHGPALAAGWVVLTVLPLLRSYITTCRSTATDLNATIMTGLTPETLTASQMDRSSIIALVPARPVSVELEDYQPVALKPSAPRTESAAHKAELPEPVKSPTKLFKPKPQAQKPAESPHKMRMNWDAQALIRTRMHAQLEAQLEALNQAEIELKAAPTPARPASRLEAEASAVSSARVRSRIKKFRTRYDAGARPEKPVDFAPEVPETLAGARPPVGTAQTRKVQV